MDCVIHGSFTSISSPLALSEVYDVNNLTSGGPEGCIPIQALRHYACDVSWLLEFPLENPPTHDALSVVFFTPPATH